MVKERHFEYDNWVVNFSKILLKNGNFKIHGDLGVKHYINSHKI